MTDRHGLLALQQVSDSSFPSGMFTHSLGLEQLVREGTVVGAADVEAFTGAVLQGSVAMSDAVAAAQAVGHARRGDVTELVGIDHALCAMKAATELRRASVETGRSLLEEVAAHHDAAPIGALLAEVRLGRSPGTHAVAFGTIAATFGATPEEAAALVMQTAATAVLHAAMRLFPMSHRDVQGALHRMRPVIVDLAGRATEPDRRLESFHPLQDVAAMRHEAAAVRMFAS